MTTQTFLAMVNPSKHIYTYTCINIAIYQYALNMYMYLVYLYVFSMYLMYEAINACRMYV